MLDIKNTLNYLSTHSELLILLFVIFISLIRVLAYIPKFNPPEQYEREVLPKELLGWIIKGVVAFVIVMAVAIGIINLAVGNS